MMNRKAIPFFQRIPVLLLCAFISCLLWGSAIPVIKLSYQAFGIVDHGAGSTILFAGIRFIPAGLMTVLFGSIIEKKPLIPRKGDWRPILTIAVFQTFLQYFTYYIALIYTSGMSVAILCGTNTFFAIGFTAWVFRTEKLTARKLGGCLLGFGGLVFAQLGGGDFTVSLLGDGLMIVSACSAGFAAVLMSRFSKERSPILLSGWQFVAGGIGLVAVGLGMGGTVGSITPISLLTLFYLAMVSAVAFSLWSILLKNNPVSRVTVFGFLTPLFGTILSAVLLDEYALIRWNLVLALILVCAGILCVNLAGKGSENAEAREL